MNAVAEEVGYGCADETLPSEALTELIRQPQRLAVVTGAQKRKINRLVARAVAIEILAAGTGQQLDVQLMPIDRIQQRWAVSIGSGLPSEAYDDAPSARPPPLDDVTAILVDQINLHAPDGYRFLLRAWYKSPVPAEIIASNLGLSRNGVYVEWKAALSYLKAAFLASKHADLIYLVNVQA